MKYAVSDIHGHWDKYQSLLERLDLGPEDTLYVLGDVIDRGPEGFRIMADMAKRPNVLGLLGNHEDMAQKALPAAVRARRQGRRGLSREDRDAIDLWFYNGGEISLDNLLSLSPEDAALCWAYMQGLPLYREVEAGGMQYVLVHGGLDNFDPLRPLSDYETEEIVWARPNPTTVYYRDRFVVLGHTPTEYLYMESGRYTGLAKFYRADTFIDIDCGCAYNRRLGCLNLDTRGEIYL